MSCKYTIKLITYLHGNRCKIYKYLIFCTVKLSEKLLNIRQMSNLSLNKMANLLLVSPPTYKKIENGEANLPASGLNALAQRTGLDAAFLASDTTTLPDFVVINQEPAVKTVPAANGTSEQDRWRRWLRSAIERKTHGQQEEFAELIEIDGGLLSRLLNGKKPLTEKMMWRISRATNMYDWQAGGEQTTAHEGRQLKKFFTATGLVQDQVAQKMGVSPSALSGYFSKSKLHARTWAALEKATGIGYNEIMEGKYVSGEGTGIESGKNPIFVNRTMTPISDLMKENGAEILSVPAKSRAGFNFSFYSINNPMTVTIPVRLLNRLHVNLSEKETTDIINRYAEFEISPRDGMEPLLWRGWKVAAYRLSPEEWESALPGLYVVEYNSTVLIREIKDNTLRADKKVILHPRNPEMIAIDVQLEQIQNIWEVERITDGPLL